VLDENNDEVLNSSSYHEEHHNRITFGPLIQETQECEGKYNKVNEIEVLVKTHKIEVFECTQIEVLQTIDIGASATVYSVGIQRQKYALKSLNINTNWNSERFINE
ncbi:17953_t:CDS:1, partial [Racocetra fulgida]